MLFFCNLARKQISATTSNRSEIHSFIVKLFTTTAIFRCRLITSLHHIIDVFLLDFFWTTMRIWHRVEDCSGIEILWDPDTNFTGRGGLNFAISGGRQDFVRLENCRS